MGTRRSAGSGLPSAGFVNTTPSLYIVLLIKLGTSDWQRNPFLADFLPRPRVILSITLSVFFGLLGIWIHSGSRGFVSLLSLCFPGRVSGRSFPPCGHLPYPGRKAGRLSLPRIYTDAI